MPVELRKRKVPAAPPAPAPKKAASSKPKGAGVTKRAPAPAAKKAATPAAAAGKVAVGDVVKLDGFGGEGQANDGATTSLKKLVDESKAGVVLFTYPKASTPGCKFFSSFISLHNKKNPEKYVEKWFST